jgi:hypothetical protein
MEKAASLSLGDLGLSSGKSAIHPGLETFTCRCGKPDCAFACLQPFREHIARLFRAIVSCEHENILPHDWQAVLYPLQMAASLKDIDADTSYVDETQSVMLCSGAANYEDAHTDVVRQYVAGLTIFTFLWAAYEAAVQLTRPEHLRGLSKDGRNGERGRRLFEDFSKEFPPLRSMQNLNRLAVFFCEKGQLFEKRLTRLRERYKDRDMSFSAELCREFRNFIAHGEDAVPEPAGWGDTGASIGRIRRFYAVSRLLLLLIQALAFLETAQATNEVEWEYQGDGEYLIQLPNMIFAGLHMLKLSTTDRPE